jgi:hypothetical protein
MEARTLQHEIWKVAVPPATCSKAQSGPPQRLGRVRSTSSYGGPAGPKRDARVSAPCDPASMPRPQKASEEADPEPPVVEGHAGAERPADAQRRAAACQAEPCARLGVPVEPGVRAGMLRRDQRKAAIELARRAHPYLLPARAQHELETRPRAAATHHVRLDARQQARERDAERDGQHVGPRAKRDASSGSERVAAALASSAGTRSRRVILIGARRSAAEECGARADSDEPASIDGSTAAETGGM